MVNKKRLLMSVKEARKLLGKGSMQLTNKEIETLVIEAEHLARFTVQQQLVRKSEMLQ